MHLAKKNTVTKIVISFIHWFNRTKLQYLLTNGVAYLQLIR